MMAEEANLYDGAFLPGHDGFRVGVDLGKFIGEPDRRTRKIDKAFFILQ
jgi:hypothetical protein